MTYKEKKKEYMKDYYQAHKEERKAKQNAYYQAHKEERKAYSQVHYNEHREEIKSRTKAYYMNHKEECKDRFKAYNQAHKEEQNAYKRTDTNSLGKSKDSIRKKSSYYLFKTLRHTKVEGYEIHHCFGYDDFKKFIYIPKELHLTIHQFLRDNGIDADSDHYSKIEHLIVNYLKLNNRHVLIMNNMED